MVGNRIEEGICQINTMFPMPVVCKMNKRELLLHPDVQHDVHAKPVGLDET